MFVNFDACLGKLDLRVGGSLQDIPDVFVLLGEDAAFYQNKANGE